MSTTCKFAGKQVMQYPYLPVVSQYSTDLQLVAVTPSKMLVRRSNSFRNPLFPTPFRRQFGGVCRAISVDDDETLKPIHVVIGQLYVDEK